MAEPLHEGIVGSYSEESLPSLFGNDRSFIDEDLPMIEREDLPGRPVCAVPTVSVEALVPGDHVLLESSQEPYRPWYQSGLVVETDEQRGRMLLIRNTKEGVSKEWVQFESFDEVYIVQYTYCRYSEEEAISRADHRVMWKEKLYHPLFNNSHHLVTWAKTGKEYPLTEIIKDFEYKGSTHLDPTLTKQRVSSLEELEPGDHIVINDDHWLVQSIDLERNEYTAFTWNGSAVIRKQRKWDSAIEIVRFDYDLFASVYAAESAVTNAESDIRISFSSSDEFVTMMKTGKKHILSNDCTLSPDGPVSYTTVTSDTAIDEGDHLVIRDAKGTFHSVLLYRYLGEGVIMTMPDIESTALYGQLQISDFEEVYRINYRETMPVDVALKRACSEVGEEILRGCHEGEASKFISWAKTGQKSSTDITKLLHDTEPEIVQLRPWERKKILSIDEVKVGDHLIQPVHGRWFHFMVTECNTDPSNRYNTNVIYCFRGIVHEKMIQLVPRKDNIHKVCYPECLPANDAIQKARSKLGSVKLSPLARMWFVRWAKTGSEEGVEVDFLANNSVPVTKSRIVSFAQLNPGDYLVEKENSHTFSRWHHYLVTENHSPAVCSVIESWGSPSPDTVAEAQLSLKEGSIYFRLNYRDGACVNPDISIADARAQLGTSFSSGSNLTRQRFVNYMKAFSAEIISIDNLLDDRLFIPREKVESLNYLEPGDHIEHPRVSLVGAKSVQHMLVVEGVDGRRCRVLRGDMKQDEVFTFNGSQEVYRINYPERISPQSSPSLLGGLRHDCIGSQLVGDEVPSGTQASSVQEAVLGDPEAHIQVEEKLHSALQYSKSNILKPVSTALDITATKSTRRQLAPARQSEEKGKTKSNSPKGTPKRSLQGPSFNLGRRVALGSVMFLGGTGLGLFVIVEAPLLARGIYKLHRKKKFEHVSEAKYKQEVIKEAFTSTNVLIGAVGGAIVGQAVIPLPLLGAGIGGAVGAVAGQFAGKAEGYAVSKLVQDTPVTLPFVVRYSYTKLNSV